MKKGLKVITPFFFDADNHSDIQDVFADDENIISNIKIEKSIPTKKFPQNHKRKAHSL